MHFSKFLIATLLTTPFLLQSTTALPTSAAKCDIWDDLTETSYGPHQKSTGTNGNTVKVVGATTYTPGTAVTITVASGGTFQGFQIYATDSAGRRVGAFDGTGTNSAGLVQDCGCTAPDPTKPWTEASTFGHNSPDAKPANLQIKWTPDPTAVGTVTFTATVMPNQSASYKVTGTITRDAKAPAPVAVVDPTAPIVGGSGAGGGQQQQPTPTQPIKGGAGLLAGISDAKVVDPYKPGARPTPPPATKPPATSNPAVPGSPVVSQPVGGGSLPVGSSPVSGSPVGQVGSTTTTPTSPVIGVGIGQLSAGGGQIVEWKGALPSSHPATDSSKQPFFFQSDSKHIHTGIAAVMTLSAIVVALVL